MSITVYNMCVGKYMIKGKLEKKLEVLREIAEEVNKKAEKIKDIKEDALVAVSDIEGRAGDFLVKLKHTGVIDWVDVWVAMF